MMNKGAIVLSLIAGVCVLFAGIFFTIAWFAANAPNAEEAHVVREEVDRDVVIYEPFEEAVQSVNPFADEFLYINPFEFEDRIYAPEGVE